MSANPIDFLSPGVELELWRIENEVEGFLPVKLEHVIRLDSDDDGAYALCKLSSNEGCFEALLHEKDFESKDSADAWQYAPPQSTLVGAILDAQLEISDLAEEIEEMREELAELKSKDDASQASDLEAPAIASISKAAMHIAIAVLSCALTYRAIAGSCA